MTSEIFSKNDREVMEIHLLILELPKMNCARLKSLSL